MSTIARPVVFSDIVPKIKLRNVALVLVAVALTALLAQIEVGLGFTPVPITGQTLAVLLAGAVLGSRLGAISMGTYVLAGLFLPFYAGGDQGWTVLSGASGGYLIGMIVAAYVVGTLAERMQDRTFLTSIPAMLFGSAIVYAIGVPWLAIVGDLSAVDAIEKGLAPFVVADAAKALIAGAALPIAWKFVQKDSASSES